ncbi:hypothetical protein [Gracilibacillus halophilus]|uniref:hypothetical protein n=1 Tax=Gracilibacillus halophilus TaxID=470864 RepID=UPI00039B6A83|nr:hypothetical protein [Gracilibacillus halophilus]
MKAIQFLNLQRSLAVAFPNSTIGKWISHGDHEEIELNTELGKADIRFYPKGEGE